MFICPVTVRTLWQLPTMSHLHDPSHFVRALLLLFATTSMGAGAGELVRVDPETPILRRPMSLAISPSRNVVYVANRDNGALSLVDLESTQVGAEWKIGTRLVDITVLDSDPSVDELLVIDEAQHCLWRIRVRDNLAELVDSTPVARHPVRLTLSPDKSKLAVASLWSRRVSVFDVRGAAGNRSIHPSFMKDLPFAPRGTTFVANGASLLVADAFGGNLVVLDPTTGETIAEHALPAQNLAGVYASPDGNRVFVPHQMLNESAETIESDIHWGLVVANDLRILETKLIRGPTHELIQNSLVTRLGEPGHGSADPTAFAMSSNGSYAAAIGGTNEVLIGRGTGFIENRVRVGARPSAVSITPDGKRAVVANLLEDSLSIVDMERPRLVATIPLGETPEPTGLVLGEKLFYSARFSHDGWMTCHSCHTEGHTTGERADNLGDGTFGASKLTPSLLGHGKTAPFGWNGSKQSLSEQIRSSIALTMRYRGHVADSDVSALVSYVESLPSPPPLDGARGLGKSSLEERGYSLFQSKGCVHCHTAPSWTSDSVHDVGLSDSLGQKSFNPPSLIGVGQRDRYFHDGRARSLESVLTQHDHPARYEWSQSELAELLAFLRSL